MSFLALSAAAAFALLAGVALVIVLLHLLRPPPPAAVVPSVLLWGRVKRGAKRPPSHWLTSLLLALAAGLCMALALTRPDIPAIGATSQRLALILDNSASMAARTHDGQSRWEHAVAEARQVIESQGAADVTLMDTMGQVPASRYFERRAALTALAGMHVGGWGAAHAPSAPAVSGAQVHLFTDGVAPVTAPQGTVVHSVFEAADNVAVTAFEARALAQDPTRYEALVQVLNASPRNQRARLLIAGGEQFSIAQDLELGVGESVSATFDISDFEGGVLGASVVSQRDAFELDDVAYAMVPPHRPKRVLLVSAGNPALEDALRNLPGVRLDVVAPAAYSRAAIHEAIVFDRFAPVEAPAVGALLLQPPARNWLPGRSARTAAARITGWNASHPVSRGIAWRNVRLAGASIDTGGAVDALVSARGSASGGVVVAGEARARWIKLGFSLNDSNFALQPDFPVFLGNAVRWVTEPMPVLARGPGSLEVPLRHGEVRDGSGKAVATSDTPQGIVFDAPRADVYTVTGAEGRFRVVVNVNDPRYALINRSRLSEVAGAGETPSSVPWRKMAEPWMLLLGLAGVLLLAEWAVYTRRVSA